MKNHKENRKPLIFVLFFLLIFVRFVAISKSLSTLVIAQNNILNQSQENVDMNTTSLSDNHFIIDNVTFSYNSAAFNGIRLHYVIDGQGTPVVLLHGRPDQNITNIN